MSTDGWVYVWWALRANPTLGVLYTWEDFDEWAESKHGHPFFEDGYMTVDDDA